MEEYVSKHKYIAFFWEGGGYVYNVITRIPHVLRKVYVKLALLIQIVLPEVECRRKKMLGKYILLKNSVADPVPFLPDPDPIYLLNVEQTTF